MIRRSPRRDDDFAAEIEAHLQLEVDALIADGMDPEQARAAAKRAFGNVTRSRERFYEGNRYMWLENLWRDTRYALRQMRLLPVSTAAIVLSLTLGIGLTTAIFSLADQALLRRLPVVEPERLVQLEWDGMFVGGNQGSIGYGSLIPFPLYRELRADNEVFSDMFARATAEVHLHASDRAEAVTAEIVSGSYFPTLGVRPALGRLLDDADDSNPDGHSVLVLSFDLWQGRFGGDPGVLGRILRMNDHPMTVVGVTPEGFYGTDWSLAPAVWVPMSMKSRATPGWNGVDERGTRFAHVYGRLRPDIDRQRAAVALEPRFKSYLQADSQRDSWPALTEAQLAEFYGSSLEVLPGGRGQARVGQQFETPMSILLAATGLIFLLVCLNTANLSIARSLAARRATALRTALGASRQRIVGEQLVESTTLASCGCLGGLLLAPWVSRGMLSFLPSRGTEQVALSPELDFRVLAFAIAVTGLTTLLAGAGPAFFAASIRPVEALKRHAAGVAGGLGLRKALVVGQFALALILLVGAGLFARTLGSLRDQGPGFSTTNLISFRLMPVSDGYERQQAKEVVRRVLQQLRAMPEVKSAGVSAWPLLEGSGWNNPVTVQARHRVVTDRSIPMNAVSEDFFATLGASLVRGRSFGPDDVQPEWDLRSVILNEEFVRRYLPGEDPVGAQLAFGNRPDADPQIEIVGVVRTFHDYGLREPLPQVYFALWERSASSGAFYVRMRTSAVVGKAAVRSAVQEVDPALTVLSMTAVDEQLDRMLVNERLLASLAVAFAAVATLLAMIGMYGVLSFSAECRTKEIGIRLALGASPWTGGGLIVREAVGLAAAGLAIALPAAWALGRLVEGQLYGIRPMDATTLAASACLLAFVCLFASLAPARRLGSMNPLDALRTD